MHIVNDGVTHRNRYMWVQSCKAKLIHVFIPYASGSDFLTYLFENYAAMHVLKYQRLHCRTAREPALLGFQKLHRWQLVQTVEGWFPNSFLIFKYVLLICLTCKKMHIKQPQTLFFREISTFKIQKTETNHSRVYQGALFWPLKKPTSSCCYLVSLLGRGIKMSNRLCKYSIYLINWPEKYHHRPFLIP